jgi:hypothetical protein
MRRPTTPIRAQRVTFARPPRSEARGGADATTVSPDDGQAAVELVALVPLVGVLITALAVALHAHRAREQAAVASHAGAIAALVGRDPTDAARKAAPGVGRDRLQVRRDGRRITVRVRAEGPRALVREFDAEQTVTLPPEVVR